MEKELAKDPSPIAVTSRSFSKHPVLRRELAARFSNITFNDEGVSLAGSALISFLRSHSHAIVALEKMTPDILAELPELKVISKYGVGIDNLNLAEMEKRGIRLGWQPGVNRRSVAELALCFMLAALRKVVDAHHEVQAGTWRQLSGGLLTEKTVGLVGCGHVGKELISLLAPFRCKLLVHDILDLSEFCKVSGAVQVSAETLLTQSDVVSLHLPLFKSTRGWLDDRRFQLMKPGAVLINTARGGMVDELVLKKRLMGGQLAAAAFDVFANEPPPDRELLNLPNFFATPHIGGSADEAVLAMGRTAIEGLSTARDAREFFAFADA